jgi:hypothetical protein
MRAIARKAWYRMRLSHFAQMALLVGIGLQALSLPLRAQDGIDLTILDPDQFGAPGSSNDFLGTITNNTGMDLASTDLFLNFSGYDFANVTLNQVLGDTSFDIPDGTTSAVTDLFTFDLAGTAPVPFTFPAQVVLEDVAGDLSPVRNVSVSTVTPEPGSLTLIIVAALLFLCVAIFRRTRKVVLPMLAITLVAQMPSSAQVSSVQFTTLNPGLAQSGTTLMIALPIINSGTMDATNVTVTAATLRSATLATPLPVALGTIPANTNAVFQVSFNDPALVANTSYLLTVRGTYNVGAATAGFTVNRFLVPPPAGPGQGTAGSVSVAPLTVSGAPFPPQPVDFPDDANSSLPPIPTGLFVPVTPSGGTALGNNGNNTQALNGAQVAFSVNKSLGISASGTAEPSGGASGGGVVFTTANWTAAYSTDGGSTFKPQLDPTTIFPKDVVGFCCDQIAHYVPSIDRVVWLLQGNGYRLASASPAQIVASGGTAWTYWNLPPSVFGPSGSGFDYPDMSVGDNFLYVSWDTGCSPNCNGGRQIARIPLSQIGASATINIGFTHQSDSNTAWGAHLTQDTGNEIFWAGHNGNSTLRVFSWAEGSNTYFWRDIGISSWANSTPISSLTPDGKNWVDFLFDPTTQNPGGGFPLFAVLGSTRSGNNLWFAWSAGTDNNFPQPHIEMVTLDRGNNFNKLQQVQIWNNSLAFAYPALATNACTGEIGLSLEVGGGGNYENHAVGFWGDFLVYFTTNSNVGSIRYGDYVTIRQNFNPGLRGAYFDAFGYGINSNGDNGPKSDVHYVVFGRPGACLIN